MKGARQSTDRLSTRLESSRQRLRGRVHCLPRLLTRPQAHPHEEVWCPSFLKRGRDTCENVFGQSARRLAKGCRCAHRKVCDHFGGRAATSGGASFDTSRIVSPMVECAHRFQALRPGFGGRAVDKEKIILRHIRIRPPQTAEGGGETTRRSSLDIPVLVSPKIVSARLNTF